MCFICDRSSVKMNISVGWIAVQEERGPRKNKGKKREAPKKGEMMPIPPPTQSHASLQTPFFSYRNLLPHMVVQDTRACSLIPIESYAGSFSSKMSRITSSTSAFTPVQPKSKSPKEQQHNQDNTTGKMYKIIILRV